MTTAAPIIHYLPPTADRPAEPAPFLMTQDEAARFLRLTSTDPYKALWKYRNRGWLKAVQVGRDVRYRLTDLVAFIETAGQENPR